MARIDERIEESKNWFERFLEGIPGYRSYKQKELRRETDKIERVHVADRLDPCLGKLDDLKLALTESGRLDALADVDAVMRRLRKVRDRIQFADYGYSGMFDATKVGIGQLDELRAFDRAGSRTWSRISPPIASHWPPTSSFWATGSTRWTHAFRSGMTLSPE